MQDKTLPEQAWYFTFGAGQLYDGRYVVIAGTVYSARDEMLRYFGNAWSFQYASAERAGTEEFGLVELPRADWPTPVEASNPDRHCCRCGATSGIRLLHSNPLVFAVREWECVDGCKDGAR